MAPIVHCVRHAQGYHNLYDAPPDLPDPDLTPEGELQCAELASSFPNHSRIGQVLASPLKRTLATAYLGFKPALANGTCLPQILAVPEAQETSDFGCDTGSDPPEVRRYCDERQLPVDLSLLHDGWNEKIRGDGPDGGKWSAAADAIRARAKEARQLVRERVRELQRTRKDGDGDVEVVLVTHGGYLHWFTEDWDVGNRHAGTGWSNTEFRSYVFEAPIDNPTSDPNATLWETPESRTRRGVSTPQPSRAEAEKLFEKAMDKWEARGMQNPLKVPIKGGGGFIREEAETKSMDGEDPGMGNRGVRRSSEIERKTQEVKVSA